MRARYYSPDMKRFVNADIVAGKISNAVTLNRFAYANGNPVSLIDPFGLAPSRSFSQTAGVDGGGVTLNHFAYANCNPVSPIDPFGLEAERETGSDFSIELSPTIRLQLQKFWDEYYVGKTTVDSLINENLLSAFYEYMRNGILNESRPNNIGKGIWAKQVEADLKWVDDVLGANSKIAKTVDALGTIGVVIDVGVGVYKNIQDGTDTQRIITDAFVDAGFSVCGGLLSSVAVYGLTGLIAGSVSPGFGNLIGACIGTLSAIGIYFITEVVEIKGNSLVDSVKEDINQIVENATSVAMISATTNSLVGGASGGLCGGGGSGSNGLACEMLGMKEYSHLLMRK